MYTVLRSSTSRSFLVFLVVLVFSPSLVRSQEATPRTNTPVRAASQEDAPTSANPVAADSQPLDGREGRDLLLSHFRPAPNVKVKQTLLTRAKIPVVDVHTHFRYRLKHSPEQLDALGIINSSRQNEHEHEQEQLSVRKIDSEPVMLPGAIVDDERDDDDDDDVIIRQAFLSQPARLVAHHHD